MINPQPENIDAAVATEEEEFRPAEKIRILRLELAERLAMLTEKYAAANSTANSVKEVAVPVQRTFQEHLEAAITAISQLQPQSVHTIAVQETTATKPVKIETTAETAAENQILPVLKGMNSIFVFIGSAGLLWTVLYYLRGDDISQIGLPLAAAGIGLITVGIGGRLIQDYINRGLPKTADL